MKWELEWNDPFSQYLGPFEHLVGDRRKGVTLTETVRGIIGSGSLVCQQIAAHAPVFASVLKGAQRIIRMLTGQTTKRSPKLDAAHLTEQLRIQSITRLHKQPPAELWLLADVSDLRKPFAKAMPNLQKVRSLTKTLVPGYRTLSVLGVTPGWRGVLYHHLFSSKEPDFVSEPHETQTMLETVSTALSDLKPATDVTWVLDSGFDDVAVWRSVWQNNEHLVCHLSHLERLVTYQRADGSWQEGTIDDAMRNARVVAQAQTLLNVRKTGQPSAKQQTVTVREYQPAQCG